MMDAMTEHYCYQSENEHKEVCVQSNNETKKREKKTP